MASARLLRSTILTTLLLPPISACSPGGDGPARSSVYGKVALDGVPLKSGSITFDPKGESTASAIAAGAVVRDGSYRIDREHGPTPGSFRVSILSTDPTDAPGDAAPGAPPRPKKGVPKGTVPEKYNTKSELVQEIKPGSNQVDFDLTSQ